MQEQLSKEEAHIKRLFDERNSNQPNDTGLADTITSMVETVFASNYKFIYELLQNADDSKATAVTFNLVNGHLLVSHTGAHFLEEDVVRICANASLTAHEKNIKSKRIGYKGIGFKAVFCISEKVTIISGKYCFRFEKAYFQNTPTARYPWQVIPINSHVAEVEQIVGVRVDPNSVHFLLEKVNTVEIHEELETIFSSLEVLLTLRHVQCIRLQHANIEISRTKSENNTINLQYSESGAIIREGQWYVSSTPVKLDDETVFKEKIKNLNAAACPEKMKQAKALNLVFAAQKNLETKGVKACEVENNLYCYLPTNTKTGLPFLINVDLLLSQDRTELSKNPWNKFALKKIGEMQFAWFAALAKDPTIMPSLLEIVGMPTIRGVDKKLQKAYHKGFLKGLKNTAFIPSMTQGELLTLSACLYDETRFWQQFFGRVHDRVLLLKNGTSRLIFAQLKDAKKLEVLTGSLSIYGPKELLENIERYFHEQANLSVELLHFVKEYITANPTFLSGFAKKAILLTEKNTFAVISHCYLIEDKGARHHFVAQLDLNVVSPSIAVIKELCDWLKQEKLGLRSMTNLNVIRGHVFDLINDNQITNTNTLDIFCFVYDTYLQMTSDFDNGDFKTLTKLKVYRADNVFVPINECYLLGRENKLCGTLSISHHYYDKYKRNDSTWNEFLLKMGVKTEICLEIYNVSADNLVKLAQDQEGKDALLMYYDQIWKDNRELSTQQRKLNATTIFKNLIYFKFIHLIGDEVYAQLFWSAIAKGTRELAARCDLVRPQKNIEGVTQYLKFYLRTFPRLKAVGIDGFYRSNELYSPNLQEMFSDLPLPYASVPIQLTPAQVDFFEFKKSIDLTACLNLLNHPACNRSPQKLNKIYIILISLHDINQTKLLDWEKGGGQLLAADNELHPVATLIVNDGHGGTPFDSKWLHPCDLSPQQLLALAKFFGLQRLSLKQDEFNYKDASPGLAKDNVVKFKNLLKTFLPALAYRQSKFSGRPANIILKSCIDKLKSIHIMYYEKIQVTLLKKTSRAIYSAAPEPAVFRFSGRWQTNGDHLDEIVAVVANQVFEFSELTLKDLKFYLSPVTPTREAVYKRLKKGYGDESSLVLDQLYTLAESFEETIPTPIINSPASPVTITTNQAKTLSPPATPRGLDSQASPRSPILLSPVPNENITIKEANLTPKKSPAAPPPKTSPFNTAGRKNNHGQSDNTENTYTGRKGETYVYTALLTKYGIKYGQTNIQYVPKGFQVITPERQLDITWYNNGLLVQQDMGEDHDLKICKKEPHDLILLLPATQIIFEELAKKKFYVQKNENTFDVYWMQHKRCRHKRLLPDVDGDLIRQLNVLSIQASKVFPYNDVVRTVDALVVACDRNTRYIEVKATKKANKSFYISKAEWQKMKEAQFRYQLFRVYGVNDLNQPKEIIFVRDPVEALREEKLSVQMLELSF